MIAGKRYHGITVDIWSCGVILFAMVCGYLPFEDPNTGQLYKKILSANYQIPSFVSPECRDLIKKILDTDPRTRYTIPEIRDHPWYKQVVPSEKEGIIVGINQIPINNKVLDTLDSLGFVLDGKAGDPLSNGSGFNFDANDKSSNDGQVVTNRMSCRAYIKKCIELNKHNHFTTSYYLLLKKFNENNGKTGLEINDNSMDQIGRKTTYPGDFKSAVRGTSVPVGSQQQKIDPFAHLTPVARRFIENSELVTTKIYPNNPKNRMGSSGNGQNTRQVTDSPANVIESGDASYSPRRSNLVPSTNNAKFTTTVMGPFRGKGGYSAPEQKKRDLGYVEIGNGPLFNSRIGTALDGTEKRSISNTVKVKAQLPNVSKQRVHIKSHHDRQHSNGNPAYPNSVIAGNIIRSNNNSTKRRDIPKYPNTSFQVTNNFIQTSYGGMGNFNQTQMMNKTGYNGLVYDDKMLVNQTNTSRANKKYRITNFHPPAATPGNMNTVYLRKHNKNLFNIYK